MATKITRDKWLRICKAEILKHAGPFTGFTEDASADLDTYLTEDKIQVGDRDPDTRLRWGKVPSFRRTFFEGLRPIGLHAQRAATLRQETEALTGDPSPDLLSFRSGDLRAAQEIVGAISGTADCTPDKPPG